MNPILVFYLFLGAVILWGLLVWLFPKIGKFLKSYGKEFSEIMKEDDEDDGTEK